MEEGHRVNIYMIVRYSEANEKLAIVYIRDTLFNREWSVKLENLHEQKVLRIKFYRW